MLLGASDAQVAQAPSPINDASGRKLYTHRLLVEMHQYHTAYLAGQITPEGEDVGINVVAAIRSANGLGACMHPSTLGGKHALIDHPLDFRGDQLFLSEQSGLGVDFDVEKLEAHQVYRRPGT